MKYGIWIFDSFKKGKKLMKLLRKRFPELKKWLFLNPSGINSEETVLSLSIPKNAIQELVAKAIKPDSVQLSSLLMTEFIVGYFSSKKKSKKKKIP